MTAFFVCESSYSGVVASVLQDCESMDSLRFIVTSCESVCGSVFVWYPSLLNRICLGRLITLSDSQEVSGGGGAWSLQLLDFSTSDGAPLPCLP